MTKNKTFWVGIVAAAALALTGCGDDATGTGGTAGSGGTAGDGGTGGAMAMANVTGVHLAPAVPAADDTEVEIFLNGEPSGVTLSYAETTGRIPLPVGTYDIGLGLPGADAPLLQLDGVELAEGDDLNVIAYAVTGDIPFDVFVISNSTEGLEAGFGRVFVAHGANDPILDPVNVVTTDVPVTACTDAPSRLRLWRGPARGWPPPRRRLRQRRLRRSMTRCPPLAAGPVEVPITPDVVSIAVAVDEDPSDGLLLELFALVDADTLVRLINTEEN